MIAPHQSNDHYLVHGPDENTDAIENERMFDIDWDLLKARCQKQNAERRGIKVDLDDCEYEYDGQTRVYLIVTMHDNDLTRLEDEIAHFFATLPNRAEMK